MHIPEIRLLCVAYADNLQFDENDVSHLTECPECYQQWKLFVQGAQNRQPSAEVNLVGEMGFSVEHIGAMRMWEYAHRQRVLDPEEQAHLASCNN